MAAADATAKPPARIVVVVLSLVRLVLAPMLALMRVAVVVTGARGGSKACLGGAQDTG
jgi:hypothetical protein